MKYSNKTTKTALLLVLATAVSACYDGGINRESCTVPCFSKPIDWQGSNTWRIQQNNFAKSDVVSYKHDNGNYTLVRNGKKIPLIHHKRSESGCSGCEKLTLKDGSKLSFYESWLTGADSQYPSPSRAVVHALSLDSTQAKNLQAVGEFENCTESQKQTQIVADLVVSRTKTCVSKYRYQQQEYTFTKHIFWAKKDAAGSEIELPYKVILTNKTTGQTPLHIELTAHKAANN